MKVRREAGVQGGGERFVRLTKEDFGKCYGHNFGHNIGGSYGRRYFFFLHLHSSIFLPPLVQSQISDLYQISRKKSYVPYFFTI